MATKIYIMEDPIESLEWPEDNGEFDIRDNCISMYDAMNAHLWSFNYANRPAAALDLLVEIAETYIMDESNAESECHYLDDSAIAGLEHHLYQISTIAAAITRPILDTILSHGQIESVEDTYQLDDGSYVIHVIHQSQDISHEQDQSETP